MKLSELLQDRGRLVNRLPVPVLMSTEAAERVARAQTDADLTGRQVERAERAVKDAEAAEEGRMQRPRTEAAKTDLERAQAKHDAAEVALEEARVAAEKYLVDFVVQSIGSDEWEELVNAHPPTEEQRERISGQSGAVPQWNPATFPLDAVAACLAEPEVDGVEDVRKLKASVPEAVWYQLFAAVVRVNQGANRVDPSLLGSATTRISVSGSEQPAS